MGAGAPAQDKTVTVDLTDGAGGTAVTVSKVIEMLVE